MSERHQQLIAYLATLATLLAVFVAALVAVAWGKVSNLEALGLGTITGGLIGVLRLPTQRNVTVDNPPTNPVQTEDAAP